MVMLCQAHHSDVKATFPKQISLVLNSVKSTAECTTSGMGLSLLCEFSLLLLFFIQLYVQWFLSLFVTRINMHIMSRCLTFLRLYIYIYLFDSNTDIGSADSK